MKILSRNKYPHCSGTSKKKKNPAYVAKSWALLVNLKKPQASQFPRNIGSHLMKLMVTIKASTKHSRKRKRRKRN